MNKKGKNKKSPPSFNPPPLFFTPGARIIIFNKSDGNGKPTGEEVLREVVNFSPSRPLFENKNVKYRAFCLNAGRQTIEAIKIE